MLTPLSLVHLQALLSTHVRSQPHFGWRNTIFMQGLCPMMIESVIGNTVA